MRLNGNITFLRMESSGVTKANSINSKLFSSSDIQSIVKKAIVERLKKKYAVSWFDEDGDSYPIRVSIMKDIVTVSLDTSGDSLHKRGYRPAAGKAPISETLAAGSYYAHAMEAGQDTY